MGQSCRVEQRIGLHGRVENQVRLRQRLTKQRWWLSGSRLVYGLWRVGRSPQTRFNSGAAV